MESSGIETTGNHGRSGSDRTVLALPVPEASHSKCFHSRTYANATKWHKTAVVTPTAKSHTIFQILLHPIFQRILWESLAVWRISWLMKVNSDHIIPYYYEVCMDKGRGCNWQWSSLMIKCQRSWLITFIKLFATWRVKCQVLLENSVAPALEQIGYLPN